MDIHLAGGGGSAGSRQPTSGQVHPVELDLFPLPLGRKHEVPQAICHAAPLRCGAFVGVCYFARRPAFWSRRHHSICINRQRQHDAHVSSRETVDQRVRVTELGCCVARGLSGGNWRARGLVVCVKRPSLTRFFHVAVEQGLRTRPCLFAGSGFPQQRGRRQSPFVSFWPSLLGAAGSCAYPSSVHLSCGTSTAGVYFRRGAPVRAAGVVGGLHVFAIRPQRDRP